MTSAARLGRVAVPAGALLGAGAAAGTAFAPWWRRDYDDALTGPLRVTLTGGDLWAAFLPLALVILAGFAAATISRGVWRRVIGTLLAAAALGIAAGGVMGLIGDPAELFAAALTRPATPVSDAVRVAAGPLLALLGAAASGLAGVLIAVVAQRPRGRATAYEAPSVKRDTAASARAVIRPDELAAAAESGDLWRALDAGVDPTADEPR